MRKKSLRTRDIIIEDDAGDTIQLPKYKQLYNAKKLEFHSAGNEINDAELDRLYNFTIPISARDPKEVAISVEDEIVYNIRNKYYDVIMILTGASDNILNIDEVKINEFRSNYNYAKLNFSEALELYPFLISTFGKDKFYIKDDGNLTLKITFDEYNTKLKDKVEMLDYSLKLDLYIINLIYNIRLKFENKIAKRIAKELNEKFYVRHSKDEDKNKISFNEDQYVSFDENEFLSDMYINDKDELGVSSVQSKQSKLLNINQTKLVKAFIKKDYSYKKAEQILKNIGFKENKIGSILGEYNHYLINVKRKLNSVIDKYYLSKPNYNKVEF